MTDAIKERARAFIEEAWSKGNLAIVDEMLTPDYVNHSPLESDQPAGREGYKRAIVTLRTAFPDLTSTVEQVLVDGDRVVTRYVARGTHLGSVPRGRSDGEADRGVRAHDRPVRGRAHRGDVGLASTC